MAPLFFPVVPAAPVVRANVGTSSRPAVTVHDEAPASAGTTVL
jgi:hypothetical protein